MRLLMLATVGGAMGTALRYLVQTNMLRLLGPAFPWWTFAINVTGSFAMGIVATLVTLRFDNSPEVRTFLATGILGGYTTFSAFSLDAANLFDRHDYGWAAFYVLGSVAFSILGLYAGVALTKAVIS